MKQFFLLFLFFLLKHPFAFGQADSARKLMMQLDSIEKSGKVIVHSEQPEEKFFSDNKSSDSKERCTITFQGCDHEKMKEFNTEFYKQQNLFGTKEAFQKAKEYLFAKYPNCTVTPVLNCK